MIYFSTWMYEETERDGGHYAQIGGTASSQSKKLIYWRCVMLFFAFAKKQTLNRNDVHFCLFTNASIMPNIDGVDLRKFLDTLGVQIILLHYRWRPNFPSKQWYNQFYVFDVLDYFETHANPDDHFIIADSDCLAVKNLDDMFDCLCRDGYLTIDVETQPDEDINGISRRQAAGIYGALGATKQPIIAPYFGGEFFGISGQFLGPCLAIARDTFQINNRRAESGARYLTEEAHLLSYAFVQMGLSEANADRFVRRIWTTWKSNNTRKSDLDLLVWHVPAEKILGIKKLARELARAVHFGQHEVEFSFERLSVVLGVGKKRLPKLASTYVRSAVRRLIRLTMKQ